MSAAQENEVSNDSVLNIQSVSKAYGKKQVLDDITLEVHQGEILGLIGLNGMGKTTMIKGILDLCDMDAGDITISGMSTAKVASRKNLSYLPEKFTPSKYLYGHEYLKLALSYYGKELDLELAKTMAKDLALDPEALDRKVGGYSKGMGQKLGLVGAFLVDQEMLILDEPMSGLDPQARIHLKRMLTRMREEGKSIFFSSHILSDIDEICDRIAILHDTKLIFVGTPKDFKTSQETPSLEEAFLKAIGDV
ncbi:MAG: ABC transporter ATP-binding protein [Rickettsiales bacterium]|nr:ABC transporter ATP-binding protein [Rickettsiales bacterium]